MHTTMPMIAALVHRVSIAAHPPGMSPSPAGLPVAQRITIATTDCCHEILVGHRYCAVKVHTTPVVGTLSKGSHGD